MKLWLDDERTQPEGWVWAKTADEAIHHLKSHKGVQDPERIAFFNRFDTGLVPLYTITHMSFDHDLADVHYGYWHLAHNPAADKAFPKDHPLRVQAREQSAKEKTGYDVLLWMAEHEVWPNEACYVHTHNSVRGPIMADMVNRYGPYDHKTVWTPYKPPVGPIPHF